LGLSLGSFLEFEGILASLCSQVCGAGPSRGCPVAGGGSEALGSGLWVCGGMLSVACTSSSAGWLAVVWHGPSAAVAHPRVSGVSLVSAIRVAYRRIAASWVGLSRSIITVRGIYCHAAVVGDGYCDVASGGHRSGVSVPARCAGIHRVPGRLDGRVGIEAVHWVGIRIIQVQGGVYYRFAGPLLINANP